MDAARFERMVARLEQESGRSPAAYQFKVAALALLGFLILGLIVGFAGLGLLLIAALVLATLFTGGQALIVLLKLGKLLVLLAVPLWLLVRMSVLALFTRLPAPQGVRIERAAAPVLFDATDAMRRRMRGPRFHRVLITDDMNAAVVQRPLFGLFGWPRNYLLLGLPLLEALAPEEALAVVAHEYGHLAGSHGRFGAFIYRLRLTWASVQAVVEGWKGWAARPVQGLVRWYAPYFNAYTFVLARANEYQADAASAELVGTGPAANALKRINISAARYERFVEHTFGAIRDSAQPPRDLGLRWASLAPLASAEDEAPRWLQQALQRASQLDDTHPALRDRLRALSGQAESEQLPAPLQGPSAAVAWLGTSAASLRETLQRQWHERVAAPWAERHQALQAGLQRLAELEARVAPSVEEEVERLRLRVELRPEGDHVPALAEFNARHAEQPLTLYLEACQRLLREDEAALALFERAIALDPDAIKPACERAYAFLSRRNDPRAEIWRERWNERHALELARDEQANRLDLAHELRAADLPAPVLAQLRALLAEGRKGVKRAYLVRRVLPADPSVATFVLALQLSGWARFRDQGAAIVKRLAELEWPVHLLVCTLEGRYKPLRRRLKALPGAELVPKA